MTAIFQPEEVQVVRLGKRSFALWLVSRGGTPMPPPTGKDALYIAVTIEKIRIRESSVLIMPFI